MNFLFTITAHGFEKADKLEKSLKSLGIPYEVVQAKSAAERKKKRTIVDKIKLVSIVQMLDQGFSTQDIMNKAYVGRSTVERIRAGTHTLQLRDKVTNIKKGVKK